MIAARIGDEIDRESRLTQSPAPWLAIASVMQTVQCKRTLMFPWTYRSWIGLAKCPTCEFLEGRRFAVESAMKGIRDALSQRLDAEDLASTGIVDTSAVSMELAEQYAPSRRANTEADGGQDADCGAMLGAPWACVSRGVLGERCRSTLIAHVALEQTDASEQQSERRAVGVTRATAGRMARLPRMTISAGARRVCAASRRIRTPQD